MSVLDLAVQPFLLALGINLARWLVGLRLGLRAHFLLREYVAFEHFAMAVVGALLLVDAVTGEHGRLIPAFGIAVAFCRSAAVSNHKTADVVCAFAALHCIQVVLRVRLLNSAITCAALACLLLLFMLLCMLLV